MGIVDIDPGQRSAVARATDGVPIFDCIESALRFLQPDGAIVATPHDTHLPLARALLSMEVPTLVEKPLARSRDEALELQSLSSQYETPVATLLPSRFNPNSLGFFDAVVKLDGAPITIDIRYDVRYAPGQGSWRSSRERAGGGVVIDMGYHHLDLACRTLGSPDDVTATLVIQNDEAVERSADIVMRFDARNCVMRLRLRALAGLPPRQEAVAEWSSGRAIATGDSFTSTGLERLDDTAVKWSSIDSTTAQVEHLCLSGFFDSGRGWREDLSAQLDVLALVERVYGNAVWQRTTGHG